MISRYEYEISDITITLDKEYTIEKRWINNLGTIHDFNNRKAPVVTISLALDTEMIAKIFQSRNNILMKLEITEVALNDKTVVSKELVVKKTFNAIISSNENEYPLYTSTDSPEKSNTDSYKHISFYLTDLKDISYFDKEASIILNNSTLSDALATVFKIRGVPDKTVIATPPRSASEPNIILTRGNMISNIEQLNFLYGMYNCDALIYKDWFYFYCLNKKNPNILLNTLTDFNTVKLKLENENTPHVMLAGSYNDSIAKMHIVNLNAPPTVRDMSSYISNIEFSTILGVDRAGNVVKQTLNNNVTKMKYISALNPIALDQNINTIVGPSKTISTRLYDTSFKIFKPHKTYIFDLDTQYPLKTINKDRYRLTYLSTLLDKIGDGSFSCTIDVQLAKI